tara:strand:+ start:3651 stop:4901 length:1251 start_codon:yes stop_codon:yes gene_type:complete
MNITNSDLMRLIENQKENFPLEQKFFTDKEIFEKDFKHIFSNQWVFIGHTSRIPKNGDYFTVQIANESIIVIRDRSGNINCFYNVCRHRGSHICTKAEGSLRKLTCPYHAWTYNLDGSLGNASMMDDDFNKEEWGLISCYKNIFEGLIFINLSNKPSDFNEFIKPLKPFISLHGLGKSKIALRKVYEIEGNWKLTLDNFHECYHCHPSHPEYCDVHSKDYIQSYGAGSNTGPESLNFKTLLNDWNQKVDELGYFRGEYSEKKISSFYRSAERTPFSNGRLSETKTGEPASKLMGKFKEYDGGYTTIGPSPFNSLIMSNDFATCFTFLPKETLKTEVELMWLVDESAVDGVDYKKDNISWLWHETTLADKRIIEDNQKGVLSKEYIPGPLSKMEVGLEKFKNWYLQILKDSINQPSY